MSGDGRSPEELIERSVVAVAAKVGVVQSDTRSNDEGARGDCHDRQSVVQ